MCWIHHQFLQAAASKADQTGPQAETVKPMAAHGYAATLEAAMAAFAKSWRRELARQRRISRVVLASRPAALNDGPGLAIIRRSPWRIMTEVSHARCCDI